MKEYQSKYRYQYRRYFCKVSFTTVTQSYSTQMRVALLWQPGLRYVTLIIRYVRRFDVISTRLRRSRSAGQYTRSPGPSWSDSYLQCESRDISLGLHRAQMDWYTSQLLENRSAEVSSDTRNTANDISILIF